MTDLHKRYLALYRDGQDMADWYDVASSDIVTTCRTLLDHRSAPVRPETLAGYLAAFSPRTSVKRSVIWSLAYVRDGTFTHDCPRTVRACALHFEHTGRVRGPKVGPFHRALLGDPDAVVIDTHMLSAAGYPPSASVSQFASCIAAVRSVARNRTTPARAQAAIWCGHLRTLNRTPRYLPLLETLWL
jgi:hypothetical protein